jgi:hypothetical protein
MARSILLYLGMLVLVGGGFEGIRRLGNTLTPPRHIAGAWRITVPSPFPSCPLLEFNGTADAGLQVEQSGRYVTLTFTDVHRTRLRARFDDGELRGSGPSPAPCASGKELYLSGGLKDGHLEIVLTPSQNTSLLAVPALVLVATRVSGADSRPPTSP